MSVFFNNNYRFTSKLSPKVKNAQMYKIVNSEHE